MEGSPQGAKPCADEVALVGPRTGFDEYPLSAEEQFRRIKTSAGSH